MKRNYESLSITRYVFELESHILAGSVTDRVIAPGQVTVKDFESDTGFDAGGFEADLD